MQNSHSQRQAQSAYDLILTSLLDNLKMPAKLKELASLYEVSHTQMKDWIDRAIADNHIIKSTKGKDITYIKSTITQLSLENISKSI